VAAFNWRDHLAVHPAADDYPLMSEDELKELADDIAENGLEVPIVICTPLSYRDFVDRRRRESSETKKKREASRQTWKLLDGRNRLDALQKLREQLDSDNLLTVLEIDEEGELCLDGTPIRENWRGEENIVAYTDVDDKRAREIAASLNEHRRHLTAEQKRDLIAKRLKEIPEASNRQIAEHVKADDKTVAKVRADLESRSEIPNVSTRTDTKGRTQPAKRKAKVASIKLPPKEPEPTAEDSAEARKAGYAETEADEARGDDGGDTPEQIWYRGLIYRASEAAASAAYSNWQREYGDWSQFKVTPELIALTDQAIESWQKLKAKLSELPQETTAPKANAA